MKVEFCPKAPSISEKEREVAPLGNPGGNLLHTYSGTVALSLILRYLTETGVGDKLTSKVDAVLTPIWMCKDIYKLIHDYCQTSPVHYSGVKVMYVYHQWGFPQDMESIMNYCNDKKLFIIEDCAHAFDSYHGGRRVGTFGDASIFSFTKFFPCSSGGALYCADRDMFDYVTHDEVVESPKLDIGDVFKMLLCPQHIVSNELNMRKDIYKYLCDELSKIVYMLCCENVTPWAVPIFINITDKIRQVGAELMTLGIECGLYHFDRNCDMINPSWIECLLVPCHQQLSDNDLDTIIETVKKYV